MDVKAKSKYIRISSQKVRKIINVIKGKPIEFCLDTLKFMPQKAAKIIDKTLKSAIANAENNHNLNIDTLKLSNIIVDQGPTSKRFRPRARGRGSRILKRTSHITVIVSSTGG